MKIKYFINIYNNIKIMKNMQQNISIEKNQIPDPPLNEDGMAMITAHIYHNMAKSNQLIWNAMEKFYSSMIVDIQDITIPNDFVVIKVDKMQRFRVLWIKTSSVIYRKTIQNTKSKQWTLYLIDNDKRVIHYIETDTSDFKIEENKTNEKTLSIERTNISNSGSDVELVIPDN